jgi:hypothetical protein
MRVIGLTGFGGTEVLRIDEADMSEPGNGIWTDKLAANFGVQGRIHLCE